MDFNDKDDARFYFNDPFILGALYHRFGWYVGRAPHDHGVYVFATDQQDGDGDWLWNSIGPWEIQLIEDVVEKFYNNLSTE